MTDSFTVFRLWHGRHSVCPLLRSYRAPPAAMGTMWSAWACLPVTTRPHVTHCHASRVCTAFFHAACSGVQ